MSAPLHPLAPPPLGEGAAERRERAAPLPTLPKGEGAICRLPGWVQRLNALLDRAAKEPFRWGVFDCCLLAADSVEALTGFDPAAGLRGTYSDEEGARKILEREGGLAALVGRICRERGFREIAPLYAQRGDVAVVTVANPLNPPPGSGEGAASLRGRGLAAAGRETAGLVSGAWVYCPKEPAGFVPVPLRQALAVWHIPFHAPPPLGEDAASRRERADPLPTLPKGAGANSAEEGKVPCPR